MSTIDLILTAAAKVVLRDGVAGLTIDAVAAAANLSKGGVLYHFASKEKLIEGMICRLIDRFEANIVQHLGQADSTQEGSWVRAFLQALAEPGTEAAAGAGTGADADSRERFAAIVAALANDPSLLRPLQDRYAEWQARLEHDGVDRSIATVVRMAAEGLWLSQALSLGKPDEATRRHSLAFLSNLTRKSWTEKDMATLVGWPLSPDSVMDRNPEAEYAFAAEQAAERSGQITRALEMGQRALVRLQTPAGYWCGDLTADSTLLSDYVLLQLWLHPPAEGQQWDPPKRERLDKVAAAILASQLPDGGWNIYPGGAAEVNASTKAYVALKLLGVDANQPEMRRARAAVLALGGVHACNSYTKLNLSFFNLYPRKDVPTVPPEIMLLPGIVLYEMSSWTRTIVVPLSIVQALAVSRPVPQGFEIDELFHPDGKRMLPQREGLAVLFHHLDKLVKLWQRRGPKNLRQSALREAERWMLERTRVSEGLGAIYPAMMYHIMALTSLGYAEDHPDLVNAMRQFENLLIDKQGRFEFQPCLSPVWDTAYSAFVLGEIGEGRSSELTPAADWMLSKEIRRKGDWSIKRPNLEPSGWAFEFANEYYPDIDDTAMVLLGLAHAQASDGDQQQRCVKRAVNWLIGMQSEDGGWAAFDVDNNWQFLNKAPFADHNAMLDPTCPDITGRVLEALTRHGVGATHESVRKGVAYLLRVQEKNGSWHGRWGVNYIYGTFLAMRGLRGTESMEVRRAMELGARWLRSVQNKDGGWGESCASYAKAHFVPCQSTPSQTAWALLGLEAAGDTTSAAVESGVAYLIATQEEDGTWKEDLATGTGFPNVFFLTYSMYRQYFPLLALGVLWRRLQPAQLEKLAQAEACATI